MMKFVSSSKIYNNSRFSTKITVLPFFRKIGFFQVLHLKSDALKWLTWHKSIVSRRHLSRIETPCVNEPHSGWLSQLAKEKLKENYYAELVIK